MSNAALPLTLLLVAWLAQQPQAGPQAQSAALGWRAGPPPAPASPSRGSANAAQSALDFEYFKTKVQPIFLTKRPGHARCISCHASGTPMRLQPLPAGSTMWNDEDSHKNFQAVSRMVVPGSLKSPLLMHPLETDAGGDFFHNGGKHWKSQNDPEWQTLKAWVMGTTTSGSK